MTDGQILGSYPATNPPFLTPLSATAPSGSFQSAIGNPVGAPEASGHGVVVEGVGEADEFDVGWSLGEVHQPASVSVCSRVR